MRGFALSTRAPWALCLWDLGKLSKAAVPVEGGGPGGREQGAEPEQRPSPPALHWALRSPEGTTPQPGCGASGCPGVT